MRKSSRPGARSATFKLAAPHGGAEPLDQPRLTDDQAVALHRAREWAIAAEQADAHVRRCFWQQFRGSIAEAALIEDEEVEPGEVWCNHCELLAQRSLRQAQCSRDGEPLRRGVEEQEGAVVTPAGEVEACNTTGDHWPRIVRLTGHLPQELSEEVNTPDRLFIVGARANDPQLLATDFFARFGFISTTTSKQFHPGWPTCILDIYWTR